MSEPIYRYYERELTFIRQMAQEFARAYPGAAGRLLLEPNQASIRTSNASSNPSRC